MRSQWVKTLFAVGLACLVASCASKKKAPETATPSVGGAETTPTPEAAISTKEMTFDAVGSDSGKIAGLNTIHFDYDQSALTTEARSQLAQNAEWIKTNTTVSVQIEGHCDSRGTVEYNLALGERRAKSVKNYLVTLGIDAKRMSIISYGKEKPVAQGDSEDAMSKNRRANFVPLPK